MANSNEALEEALRVQGMKLDAVEPVSFAASPRNMGLRLLAEFLFGAVPALLSWVLFQSDSSLILAALFLLVALRIWAVTVMTLTARAVVTISGDGIALLPRGRMRSFFIPWDTVRAICLEAPAPLPRSLIAAMESQVLFTVPFYGESRMALPLNLLSVPDQERAHQALRLHWPNIDLDEAEQTARRRKTTQS